MTARDVYEGVLIELNKVHAPTVTVEEFVYFLNKAVLAFTNDRYNFYAVNQQLSDDLRVLVTGLPINVVPNDIKTDTTGTRYVDLNLNIADYFHLLSCELTVTNAISNLTKTYPVKRMTLDMFGAVANNDYLKPALHRPYYLSLPATNANDVALNIFIGDVIKNITPTGVKVYYLKLPTIASLTDDQVFNLAADTSTILEFPDGLKNEFIKRVTQYQLEETRDQRASTFPVFNQEIPAVPLEYSSKTK